MISLYQRNFLNKVNHLGKYINVYQDMFGLWTIVYDVYITQNTPLSFRRKLCKVREHKKKYAGYRFNVYLPWEVL
jgi:hypothetical protein